MTYRSKEMDAENNQTEQKHRVAVVGYGNIGKYTVEAVLNSKDMELAGIVRRPETVNSPVSHQLADIPVVSSISELERVEVSILAVPTRQVPAYAEKILRLGINTVDSFDIHGELIDLKRKLDSIAKESGSVAIVSAGWDPGTDSMIRGMLEFMAPRGVTYTNFGPGMSMGHSTAVKAIPGVKDALSVTVPLGTGVHRRLVYIQLQDGAEFEKVKQAILKDPYFAKDETIVSEVTDIQAIIDMGHGVVMERKGVSGATHNQLFKFEMRINNPALTGQILVASARASLRQAPGAYTMLEIPIIDFLYGEKEALLRKLT